MFLDASKVADYHRDGYVLVKSLFDTEEVSAMIQEVEGGERVANAIHSPTDTKGRQSRLALWFDLG